jgi:hypothetical protein
MTLAEAITLVLNRTGTSESATEEKDQARTYLSLAMAQIQYEVNWWWLDRTTTFTTTSGTRLYTPTSGTVSSWYSFVDQTNNRVLSQMNINEVYATDPDLGDSGTIDGWYLEGTDSTSGYPTIGLYRIPANSTTTIFLRYRQEISEWSSSNDTDDLLKLGIPPIIESLILHMAAAFYTEEKGDLQGSEREWGHQSRVLAQAKRQNLLMLGNKHYFPIREEEHSAIRFGTDAVTT